MNKVKGGIYLFPAAVLFLLLGGGCSLPPAATAECLWHQRRAGEIGRMLESLPGNILTLEKAQDTALANNPDYQSAVMAVQSARMVYYQQLGAYLSKAVSGFSISQSIAHSSRMVNPPATVAPYDNRFNVSVSIAASWLLFDGLEREFKVFAAGSGAARQSYLCSDHRRLLQRAVAFAYYDVMLGQEEEAIARADVEYRSSQMEQAEKRYASGYIAKGDYLNFKILLNNARCLLVQAKNQRLTAIYALANLMGYPQGELPPGIKFTPIDSLDSVKILPDAVYVDMALAARPDLKAFREELKIRRYRKWGRLSRFFPVVELFGGWDYSAAAGHFHDYTVSRNGWNSSAPYWGVEASWVLFDGFARYNSYREAAAEETIAAMKYDAAALNAVTEVRLGCENVRTRSELVKYYADTAGWVAEQRDLITVQYWQGNVTVTRLNEAQTELVSAQSRLAVSRIGLYKSYAQLMAAVNGTAEEKIN